MNLVKIKTFSNKDEVVKWLTNLLLDSESPFSPLVQEVNRPNENFYVLIDENGAIIPSYILNKGDEALVLWVYKDFRKKGYASFMVSELNIKFAVAAPDSVSFWEKMGFKRMNGKFTSGPIIMRKK